MIAPFRISRSEGRRDDRVRRGWRPIETIPLNDLVFVRTITGMLPDYDADEDSRRSYDVAIAAMRERTLAVRRIVSDALSCRTDEQALLFLAEMVLALRDAASPGYLRARQGETPSLRLDDGRPVE